VLLSVTQIQNFKVPYRPKKICLLLFMLSVSFFLGGCAAKYTEIERPEIPTKETIPSDNFSLSPGDVIDVKFFNNPELTEEAILVRPDGKISLQLIGDVPVVNMSIEALKETIQDKYQEKIAEPEISVIVRSIHDRRIYVAGEVSAPGEYLDESGLTPFQAIIKAGGLKITAEPRSVIVFRETDEPVLSYYIVDLQNNLANLTNYKYFKLHDKDVVYVPTSHITDVNAFVQQYISNIIPRWFNVNLNYETNQVSTN